MLRMTPSEAGRLGGLKGGKSRSEKKLAAARCNGFQKATKAEPVPTVPGEKFRRVIAVPSNREAPNPQPTTATDELQQEPTSDDFTL